GLGGGQGLIPPRAQGDLGVVLCLDQVRADELLNVAVLGLRELLVVARSLDTKVFAEQRAQLQFRPFSFAAGVVAVSHSPPPTRARPHRVRSASCSRCRARPETLLPHPALGAASPCSCPSQRPCRAYPKGPGRWRNGLRG